MLVTDYNRVIMADFFYCFWLILILLTGLCVGSFMNVVIYRLPRIIYGTDGDEPFSLAWPPSHCPGCQARIRFYDNIPVLSWVLLRGKCRYCHGAISPVYPLTEAVTGLWFLAVYFFQTDGEVVVMTSAVLMQIVPLFILFCFLWCITLTDLYYYLIPEMLSAGLLWAGLLFSVFGMIPPSPVQAVLGGVLAFVVISAVRWFYTVVRKKEGLGWGDVSLFMASSVWLGLAQVPQLILFSAVCGGVFWGVYQVYHRKILKNNHPEDALLKKPDDGPDPSVYIPFGPAITLATLLLFLTRL
ncbi:prepilin peptidase [Salmonella enterica subsp. enterica serovar Oranienburg]|nr:prepilin peptidase [Salmonella enterica subsp. enterica serovar Oranienburg]ECW6486534.1 prepilin peptidase [Salmonella enterica subsp. enterica serovar Rubislaw]EDQ2493167.1 prepilin peptidase [Salmonella enterica subsp. enterica serovar Bonariensis]EEA7820520.1 prepilin peptidase [Salmonella enterica subsp. enterica serovar Miami]EBV1655891.1 prepilin peptidase [Salmonella enterica subsp. enterica serovar Oranienburg]